MNTYIFTPHHSNLDAAHLATVTRTMGGHAAIVRSEPRGYHADVYAWRGAQWHPVCMLRLVPGPWSETWEVQIALPAPITGLPMGHEYHLTETTNT